MVQSESVSTAVSAREIETISAAVSSREEEVGPDHDEDNPAGAAASEAEDGVWDIPWDPWATRGANVVLFCPRNIRGDTNTTSAQEGGEEGGSPKADDSIDSFYESDRDKGGGGV